jgi:hypothetical protein
MGSAPDVLLPPVARFRSESLKRQLPMSQRRRHNRPGPTILHVRERAGRLCTFLRTMNQHRQNRVAKRERCIGILPLPMRFAHKDSSEFPSACRSSRYIICDKIVSSVYRLRSGLPIFTGMVSPRTPTPELEDITYPGKIQVGDPSVLSCETGKTIVFT